MDSSLQHVGSKLSASLTSCKPAVRPMPVAEPLTSVAALQVPILRGQPRKSSGEMGGIPGLLLRR